MVKSLLEEVVVDVKEAVGEGRCKEVGGRRCRR